MYGSMFSEIANLSGGVKFDKRLIEVLNKHPNIRFIGDYRINEEEFDVHLPFGNLGAFLRNDLSSFKNSKKPYIDFDKKFKKFEKNIRKIIFNWNILDRQWTFERG